MTISSWEPWERRIFWTRANQSKRTRTVFGTAKIEGRSPSAIGHVWSGMSTSSFFYNSSCTFALSLFHSHIKARDELGLCPVSQIFQRPQGLLGRLIYLGRLLGSIANKPLYLTANIGRKKPVSTNTCTNWSCMWKYLGHNRKSIHNLFTSIIKTQKILLKNQKMQAADGQWSVVKIWRWPLNTAPCTLKWLVVGGLEIIKVWGWALKTGHQPFFNGKW